LKKVFKVLDSIEIVQNVMYRGFEGIITCFAYNY